MPIRTTLVGNYPKVTESGSDNLPRAIDRWQRNEMNDQALEAELQKVTRRVIREQEEAGLDLVTDGQICWEDLPHPLARSAEGLSRGALRRFFDNNVYYRRLEPANGISWRKSWVAEQFRFAAQNSKKPVKVSLPGPLTLVDATEFPKGTTREAYLARYTDCLKQEVAALAAAGAREIQLEEPALQPKEPLFEQGIEAINRIFDGVRARCWVAFYFFDLAPVLSRLARLSAEVLVLDLVTGPGLIGILNLLKDKEIALGLLDARSTRMEQVEPLCEKIRQASKVIPKDHLWLAPNCGLEFLPHEAALKKLALLKQVAERVG